MIRKYSILPVILMSSILLVACGNDTKDTTDTTKETTTTDTSGVSKKIPKKNKKAIKSKSTNNNTKEKTDLIKEDKKRETDKPNRVTETTKENIPPATEESTDIMQEEIKINEPNQESSIGSKESNVTEAPSQTETTPPNTDTTITDNSVIVTSPNEWDHPVEPQASEEDSPAVTPSEDYWTHYSTENIPVYGENDQFDSQMSEYQVPYDVETNQYLEVPMDEESISFRQAWINDQIEWAKQNGYDTQSFSN